MHRVVHRTTRRVLGGALAAAVAVSGAVVGAPADAAPGGAAGTPLRYVALGDSYSAASGVLPLVPTAPPACLRSSRNYPHVLAARLGADLVDVTCGAADTGDYAGSQYPGVAPQLDALSADTELVTMTIGGNDSGVFVNAILQCGVAGTLSLGQGDPCQRTYGDSFNATIRDVTYPALVTALQAVHQRSPQARVLIIGYPKILPATGGCFPLMPVASGDVPYLRSLQATLNDAISRAAAATGTTYVDLDGVSEGHDACQPIGTRWVEPVLLGTNPVIVHPNALGETRIAEQVLAELARSAPAVVKGTGTGTAGTIATKARLRVGRARGAQAVRPLVLTVVDGAGRRVPGARVVLQRRTARSGAWSTVRTGLTGNDGRAVAGPRPRVRTSFRWRVEPSSLYAASTSREVTLPTRARKR